MTARQTPDAARVELTTDILYLARTLVLDCQDIQQLRRVQTYLTRAVQAVQDGADDERR